MKTKMLFYVAVVFIAYAETAQAGNFTDNGNGTITDNISGLMWQKQDDGIARLWENAITYCEGLALAGHSNWRLPNIKELESITDDTVASK